MMKLCCTYIETDNFNEMVDFYEKIFEIKGNTYTENRWIEFDFGNKLSIYNRQYDVETIEGNNKNNYNQSFIEIFKQRKEKSVNNIIILNFYSDDLKNDYERIKALKICEVSDIMYVNITEPYYYFNIYDPEGNTIEICGDKFDK
ncbi:MAG: VOC family protein [Clostridium sp.]|nr:VOC family protein [Clostridium sp.]MCM1208656.1 VOC family protein [Ruminococcus sp.]